MKVDATRLLVSGEVAQVNSHWDLTGGTGPDQSPVSLGGDTTEAIRRQANGTSRYVIDDLFSMP
jgi:hypothetical protein